MYLKVNDKNSSYQMHHYFCKYQSISQVMGPQKYAIFSFTDTFLICFLSNIYSILNNSQFSAWKLKPALCFPPVSVLSLHTICVKKLSESCRTILYNQHSNQRHSPSDTLTHSHCVEASWRQARASIKPV